MPSPPLSHETEKRVAMLFAPVDQETVRSILLEDCGNNLPFLQNLDETAMDRFRFAVLKLSNGNVGKLRDAVRLAKTDWRDLLIAAAFADDVDAYKSWLADQSG